MIEYCGQSIFIITNANHVLLHSGDSLKKRKPYIENMLEIKVGRKERGLLY